VKLIMMVTNVEGYWERQTDEVRDLAYRQMVEFEHELARRVKVLDTQRFRLSGEAKTVHVNSDGSRVVRDGPFTTGNESMAGYWLVECVSMDEATELAKRIPIAADSSVELRPIWEE
jgi:hypothetical protein